MNSVYELESFQDTGGQVMEGILFIVFWLSGAALHTLFDIKVKPVVQTLREESDFS